MKAVAAASALLLWMTAAEATAQGILVGGKVGANFNQLSQPSDPAGEPTVLFGTAFSGFGFQAGASLHRQLKRFSFGPLFVDGDLLLSYQRASGYAESRTTNARRTVAIHTTGLHLPLLLGVGFAGSGAMFNVAVGPELLLGIAAGSKTKQSGGVGAGELLDVRPMGAHVGLTGQLGLMLQVADSKMPLNLRLTWDPMVGKSSQDRLVGYVDYDNPGEFQVAFNWRATLMVGWLIDLSTKADEKAPPSKDAPPGEPEPVEPDDEFDEDIELG